MSCKIYLSSIASTFDDPRDVTVLDKIDVTSLTVQIANDSLADIELVEKSIQPAIDAAWSHGLAECQVKHVFPME